MSVARPDPFARFRSLPALFVAVAGLLLTFLIVIGPLKMYGGVWYGPLAISLVAYLALIALPTPRPIVDDPNVRQAIALRNRIATYRPRAEELGAARVIDRFLTTVDTVTVPELGRLAISHRHVRDRLRGYERAAVRPDAATLGRLQTLADRQRTAIAGVLQQLANSDASIVGALETGDTSRLTDEINLAADELQRQWEASRELYEGEKI